LEPSDLAGDEKDLKIIRPALLRGTAGQWSDELNLEDNKPRIGIFDHTGPSLGGGTLVAVHLASRLSNFYSVDLIRDWSGFSLEQLSSAFSVDLARVNARRFEGVCYSFAVPGADSFRQQLERSRALTAGYDLFVCAGHWVPPFCYAKHGLIYCHFPIEVPADPEQLENAERWKQRSYFDRWLRRQAYLLAWRACLNGYDHILANSAFTAGWMERRWRARAEVVYPPVELELPDIDKQNRIVSIGRFDGDEPGRKGHRAQVEAFREFHAKVPGSWEFSMIGACHSAKDRAYLATVRDAARNLPVRFFVNVDRNAIVEALGSAKIFWHTAGLGDTKTENPVIAEHFGMATVEAMRAGCVPIVVSSGGQKEIIEHGVNGFLCKDIGELVANTVVVAESGSSLAALAREAVCRSKDFTGQVFDARILELVTRTLRAAPKRWGMRGALNMLARQPTSSLG
jgi:L-malate glycosyltransferase